MLLKWDVKFVSPVGIIVYLSLVTVVTPPWGLTNDLRWPELGHIRGPTQPRVSVLIRPRAWPRGLDPGELGVVIVHPVPRWPHWPTRLQGHGGPRPVATHWTQAGLETERHRGQASGQGLPRSPLTSVTDHGVISPAAHHENLMKLRLERGERWASRLAPVTFCSQLTTEAWEREPRGDDTTEYSQSWVHTKYFISSRRIFLSWMPALLVQITMILQENSQNWVLVFEDRIKNRVSLLEDHLFNCSLCFALEKGFYIWPYPYFKIDYLPLHPNPVTLHTKLQPIPIHILMRSFSYLSFPIRSIQIISCQENI